MKSYAEWIAEVQELRSMEWWDIAIMTEYWLKGLSPQEAIDRLFFSPAY